jgi:tetratricopeptide (TPR) repeat protein
MKQAARLLFPLLLVVPFTLTSTESPSGDKSSSFKLSKPASSLPPLDEQSLYRVMAAEMALDREHPEVALANYIAAAKETQDPMIASRATQIALTVGSLESAIEPAHIWAKAAPNDLEAQITLAALYIRTDKISDAIPYLRKTEALNPNDAFQYFLILFRQLQDENDNQRVVEALKILSKEETATASAHLALSEIYLFQNKAPEALEVSERALKIVPDSMIGIQLYSEALLRVKGKDAAKLYLDKMLQNKQTSLALHQYYAQFLYDNDYKDASKAEIEKILKTPNLSADELLQFARLSMQGQWFDLSKKILLRSSKFDESKDLSYYFLARVAEMRDQNGEAIEWFKQVLTGPFHVLSQIRASILLADKKKFDEALTLLSHTQPNDASETKQILLTTVDILNRANRYKDSLNQLDVALANDPNDLDLHYARSLVADKLKDPMMAENDLKAILEIQPHHLDALNALGYILTNHTNRYNEAEQYLSLALKLSPNNPSVLDSMGWLYYKMGNYKQSVAMLQKAQDIQPDAEIAAHLGEVLWKMQDFEGAKRVWNQALEQHPKHEDILNAMQRSMSSKKEK